MAITSDLVRKTTLLPALTKAHIDFINSFQPGLAITNIEKPRCDLWEITGRLGTISGKEVVIFLTVDGKHLGNCCKMFHPDHPHYAAANRFEDWNRWPMPHDPPTSSHNVYGFYSIDGVNGLLAELRDWCIKQVTKRQHPKNCDYYGRIWPEDIKRCPICGQPDDDDDFAIDLCDHQKFSDELVAALRDEHANRNADIKEN